MSFGQVGQGSPIHRAPGANLPSPPLARKCFAVAPCGLAHASPSRRARGTRQTISDRDGRRDRRSHRRDRNRDPRTARTRSHAQRAQLGRHQPVHRAGHRNALARSRSYSCPTRARRQHGESFARNAARGHSWSTATSTAASAPPDRSDQCCELRGIGIVRVNRIKLPTTGAPAPAGPRRERLAGHVPPSRTEFICHDPLQAAPPIPRGCGETCRRYPRTAGEKTFSVTKYPGACQRAGVARDVDEPVGRQPCQCRQHVQRAGARRIDQHVVQRADPPVPGSARPRPPGEVGGVELRIVKAVRGSVRPRPLRVLNPFDARDRRAWRASVT